MTGALTDAFARARSQDRAALVGYLPAGFPDPAASIDLITAMVAGGIDAVEIGLPYSDPLIDGPDIQAAADLALRAGTTTATVLDVVREVSALPVVPLVMSYWNPIERYGVERFAADLAAAGGTGVITPDLTPEEAGPWIAAARAARLDRVFLVAPSSTDERITQVTAVCSGFCYAASTMGVTGARDTVSDAAPALVARVRARSDIPVAVGLGVSNGRQAAEVASYADGVIVGSAFVRLVLRADSHDAACRAVRALAEDLAAGVRGNRGER